MSSKNKFLTCEFNTYLGMYFPAPSKDDKIYQYHFSEYCFTLEHRNGNSNPIKWRGTSVEINLCKNTRKKKKESETYSWWFPETLYNVISNFKKHVRVQNQTSVCDHFKKSRWPFLLWIKICFVWFQWRLRHFKYSFPHRNEWKKQYNHLQKDF